MKLLDDACKIDVPVEHPDLGKKKLGRSTPVLSTHQENDLVQYIYLMEIFPYGLTIADLRSLCVRIL